MDLGPDPGKPSSVSFKFFIVSPLLEIEIVPVIQGYKKIKGECQRLTEFNLNMDTSSQI